MSDETANRRSAEGGSQSRPLRRLALGVRGSSRRPFTTIGWLLIVAGFASLAAGWAGVQSTANVAVQLAYMTSGGLVGLALVVAGTALQGQDDATAIRRIMEELRDRFDDLEDAVSELREGLQQDPPSVRPRA